MSTSTRHSGTRPRIWRIVSAKIDAPPSGRSSRSTEVTTAYLSPIASTASATRRGSAVSAGSGRPWATAQYAHARVQTEVALAALLARDLELTADPAELRAPDPGTWRLTALPVRV